MSSLLIALACVLSLLFIILILAIIILLKESKPSQNATPCPNCHALIPIGVQRCPRCGRPLTRRQFAGTFFSPPSPVTDPAKLIAIDGPLNGHSFEIPPPPQGLTIGRSTQNDVVLSQDMIISRQHAQIMLEDGQYILYDRNSANGAFVDNQRVGRHTLQHNNMIQVGNSRFRFEYASQSAQQRQKTRDDSGAPVIDSMRLPAQTHFEGYVLLKEVGRGGMSVVYQARDARGALLAIKILDVTDRYLVQKFIQEGEIGAVLRKHPNICTVYSSGRSKDNRLYLVMEYIDGASLRRYTGQSVSEAEIISIIGQTCSALHYAHQREIVHRDIKPENILINKQGVVQVTDFGIAKLTSSVTVTGDRIVGTPEYISPEQAQAERIQPASDVYSLGIVLYELLTGRPPFPLPSGVQANQAFIQVLNGHINTPPSKPSQIRPDVSANLERVALRALEKDPRRRFSSTWEMAQAMDFQAQVVSPLVRAGWASSERPAPAQASAHLAIVSGSQAGRRISFKDKNIILGRAQIAPNDQFISGKHLQLVFQANQLQLEDTSRNGTWVNGTRVYGQTMLKDGDEIAIGNHVLRVELSNKGEKHND